MEKKIIDYIPNFDTLRNAIFEYLKSKGGEINFDCSYSIHAIIFNDYDEIGEVTITKLYIENNKLYFNCAQYEECFCLDDLYGYVPQTLINIAENIEAAYEHTVN